MRQKNRRSAVNGLVLATRMQQSVYFISLIYDRPRLKTHKTSFSMMNIVTKIEAVVIVLFVCLLCGLMSQSTAMVMLGGCLVVTGSSMLTFIVLPHCGIQSLTLYLIPPPVTLY